VKNLGINATEEELAILSNTTETGTTMLGLKQAEIDKGFLNTKGYKLTTDQLQANYIVVLKINGNYHYNIIRSITNDTLYLTDPNLGNIQMNITKFNELFISNTTDLTGYVLIVANGTIEVNGTELNDTEMQDIKAMAYTVKYKWVWVPGWMYATKKWVTIYHYEYRYRLVWVPGYWAQWGPISWYVWGHFELRRVKVLVKSGRWILVWHYHKGFWKKVKYRIQLNIPARTSKILITAKNGIDNGALNNHAMLFKTPPPPKKFQFIICRLIITV